MWYNTITEGDKHLINRAERQEVIDMKTEMYRYEISGYYFEGDERKHFCEEVEAPDNIVAMQMVLGEIMWKSGEYFNDAAVKLDHIHYEVL